MLTWILVSLDPVWPNLLVRILYQKHSMSLIAGQKLGPLSVLRSWPVYRTRNLGRFWPWRDQVLFQNWELGPLSVLRSWAAFHTRKLGRFFWPWCDGIRSQNWEILIPRNLPIRLAAEYLPAFVMSFWCGTQIQNLRSMDLELVRASNKAETITA